MLGFLIPDAETLICYQVTVPVKIVHVSINRQDFITGKLAVFFPVLLVSDRTLNPSGRCLCRCLGLACLRIRGCIDFCLIIGRCSSFCFSTLRVSCCILHCLIGFFCIRCFLRLPCLTFYGICLCFCLLVCALYCSFRLLLRALHHCFRSLFFCGLLLYLCCTRGRTGISCRSLYRTRIHQSCCQHDCCYGRRFL